MKETLSIMLSQFPLFFTIGFLGTLMLNVYYLGIPWQTIKESEGFKELIISSAVVPISVYAITILATWAWKIVLPLLGVLLLLAWIRS